MVDSIQCGLKNNCDRQIESEKEAPTEQPKQVDFETKKLNHKEIKKAISLALQISQALGLFHQHICAAFFARTG